MRGLRSTGLGIRPNFLSILTSLASGGVMIWHGVIFVEGGCGGVVSIVGSLRAHGVGEGSVPPVFLCPVRLLMVWSCWGSLILRLGGVEALLGLFELFSSSCSPSSRSSLLPLMLSPSPSSESEKSKDASATSPSRVFALVVVSPAHGKISGTKFEI